MGVVIDAECAAQFDEFTRYNIDDEIDIFCYENFCSLLYSQQCSIDSTHFIELRWRHVPHSFSLSRISWVSLFFESLLPSTSCNRTQSPNKLHGVTNWINEWSYLFLRCFFIQWDTKWKSWTRIWSIYKIIIEVTSNLRLLRDKSWVIHNVLPWNDSGSFLKLRVYNHIAGSQVSCLIGK